MNLAFKIVCFDLQAVYIRWLAHRSAAHTQSDVNDAGGADALLSLYRVVRPQTVNSTHRRKLIWVPWRTELGVSCVGY